MVLVAYAQKPPLNTHADISSGASGLNFGQSLYLHLYFVYICMQAAKALVSQHIGAGSQAFIA